ncbi:sensor histidine kinase [Spirochaeta dissipatitropha]
MKRRILFILIAMISCTAIGLSFFFGLSFTSEMDRILIRDRRELAKQVERRLQLLEELLSIIEHPMRDQAELSLNDAYNNLLSIESDPRKWDDSLLVSEAERIGSVNLYVIGPDLIVRSSSFPQDRGLRLGEIGYNFLIFLREIMGSGDTVTQRLTTSIETGALTIYSYFGPEDQDFILQLSIGLEDYLEQNRNSFSPAMLFSSLLEEHSYVVEADLFTYNFPRNWSLVSGEEVILDSRIQRELEESGQFREMLDNRLVTYQRQRFLRADNPIRQEFVLKLHYDMGYYRRVLRRFYLRGALITLILITMASGLAGVIIDKQLIRKVARLHSVLLVAHGGDNYERLEENQSVREFSEIAAALNSFMESATVREHQLARQTSDLSSALHQRDVLLREIHHRVKNNLQIIISLISIEQSRVNEASALVFEQISTRVRAMSAVHEILYEADNLEGAQLEELVERVYRSVLAVYGMNTIACSFSYNVPDIVLPIDIAIPLSLILTEAITNSLKYSNCNSETGIRLKMTAVTGSDNRGLELLFRDNGEGFPDEAQFNDGFGFILMRGLAEQIGGRLETLNDNGAVIRIILPDFTCANSRE